MLIKQNIDATDSFYIKYNKEWRTKLGKEKKQKLGKKILFDLKYQT